MKRQLHIFSTGYLQVILGSLLPFQYWRKSAPLCTDKGLHACYLLVLLSTDTDIYPAIFHMLVSDIYIIKYIYSSPLFSIALMEFFTKLKPTSSN